MSTTTSISSISSLNKIKTWVRFQILEQAPEILLSQRPEICFSELQLQGVSASDKLKAFIQHAQPLYVVLGGVKLILEIVEEKILDDQNDLCTQLKDPVYREELRHFQHLKHYSLKFKDPDQVIPSHILELKNEVREMKALQLKKIKYLPLSKTDKENEKQWIEKWAPNLDLEQAILNVYQQIGSFQQLKPIISMRVSEDGQIAELSSIVSQEKMKGAAIMQGVEEFCKWLPIKQIYLEDDAAIESSHGQYKLRLFRYFTRKDSWYVTNFGYVPYCNLNGTSLADDPNQYISSLRQKIKIFRYMLVGDLLELLKDPKFKKDSRELQSVLQKRGKNETIFSIVEDLGDRIMRKGEHHHQTLNLFLSGFLETMASYEGNEPEKLQLKSDAQAILDARFYRKSY